MDDPLGNVFSEIIPEKLLKHSFIAEYSVKRETYGEEEAVDYSLIKTINGKRYHPYCFEKINSSSPPLEEGKD